jgi:hypothetical protein
MGLCPAVYKINWSSLERKQTLTYQQNPGRCCKNGWRTESAVRTASLNVAYQLQLNMDLKMKRSIMLL